MPDPFTPPTMDDARTAQSALDPAAFEDALCAAADYLNGRRQVHGEPQMTGREVGALMGAAALAITEYQRKRTAVMDRRYAEVRAEADNLAQELATTRARVRELEEQLSAADSRFRVATDALAARESQLAGADTAAALTHHDQEHGHYADRDARRLADDAHP